MSDDRSVSLFEEALARGEAAPAQGTSTAATATTTADDDEPAALPPPPLPPRPVASATVQCATCGRAIESYYDINGKSACDDCRRTVLGHLATPIGSSGFLRAAALGFAAALAGSIVWYAFAAITGVMFGYVAIFVGYLVGAAVRRGARHRGGLKLQLLAVALTYASIAGGHMPFVFKGLKEQYQQKHDKSVDKGADSIGDKGADESAAASKPEGGVGHEIVTFALALTMMFAFACAAPFLGGTENIIGILLIAFALWRAWRMNAAPVMKVSGPYRVGRAT
jgi:hypothetical protein